jgi:nitrogen fixation/metabolism regulation signal transduction histidine kinase
MDFSFVYLAQRLLYRFLDFFHHWYVDGSRAFGRSFMKTMRSVDDSFAVAITLRHFFEPLYKDYSVVGRIMGFFFRTLRVIIGGIFYLFLAVLFAIAYLVWIAIPITILYYAARNI